MPPKSRSGLSRADQNKSIRQDALREQLAAKGLAQQAIESIKKIHDLTFDEEHQNKSLFELKKIEAQNNVRFRLLAKVLPDLKQVEAKITKEIIVTDISKVQDDLRKLEQGQTIDSTSRDISDE